MTRRSRRRMRVVLVRRRLPSFVASARWLCVLFAALAACGCQSTRPVLPDDAPDRVELASVPFFPQERYQCGPAALATVLRHAGAETTPDALVPMVYLPGRKGSLQTELIAASRRFDLVPYPLRADLSAIVRELQAGRPVLVLQNLAFKHWPQWHFAVVVGFDRARSQLFLRSGTERRATMSVSRFMSSWERADRWAMVTLRPNELPAEPDAERYLLAAAGLEAVGRLDAAEAAYRTARSAWPESLWPLLGLANVAYLRGDYAAAEPLYRELIAHDPRHLTARYNLSDTLIQRGCIERARRELHEALGMAEAAPGIRQRLQARLAEIAEVSDSGACAFESR